MCKFFVESNGEKIDQHLAKLLTKNVVVFLLTVYYIYAAESFTQRNFVPDFIQLNLNCIHKNVKLDF